MQNKKQKNRGFTLVETLIAIAIFTTSIIAIMSVLANGISNTTYAKNKMIASYLAQEGIEYIRNMRDSYVLYGSDPTTGWTDFTDQLYSFKCFTPDFPYGCGADVDSLIKNKLFACNSDGSNNPCNLYVNDGDYNSSTVGTDSGFVRKIQVEAIDMTKEIKVNSTVSWKQGDNTNTVTFSENLFNWVE